MAHDHDFGQAEPRAGESRTRIVVILTAVTMVVEIAAGIAYGSVALLADGLHMASHASALGLALIANSTPADTLTIGASVSVPGRSMPWPASRAPSFSPFSR